MGAGADLDALFGAAFGAALAAFASGALAAGWAGLVFGAVVLFTWVSWNRRLYPLPMNCPTGWLPQKRGGL